MPGYPVLWDEKAPKNLLDPSLCPYAVWEMRDYLSSCNYHWSLDKPEDEFALAEPVLRGVCSCFERRFWLWHCMDRSGRNWEIVIGSGKSPFIGEEKHVDRWMYAETRPSDDDLAERLEQVCLDHLTYGQQGEY